MIGGAGRVDGGRKKENTQTCGKLGKQQRREEGFSHPERAGVT